jgi:hypothetical protein
LVAARYFALGALLLVAVGIGGHFLAWPWLTSTLGPTAYLFLIHPETQTARLRNAVIGHTIAVAAGLFALAVFGLWTYPATTVMGFATLPQVGAMAVAGGMTLGLLELVGAHHAPAAATTLLVASGIAAPTTPLYGLLVGLGVTFVLGPLLGKITVRHVPIGTKDKHGDSSRGSADRAGAPDG